MAENLLRSRLLAGTRATNAWLAIPSAWSAEVIARAGFDAVTIDMQHGLFDASSALAALQAIDPERATPTVRLPWNDPALIMRLLDLGAQGLICPLINSAAEADQFVRACHYPPHGYRSYGPIRAALQFGSDYTARTEELLLTFAMIETADGLADVEAIAKVPRLSGLFVGPADLSLSLGLTLPVDFRNPTLRAALERVVAAAHNADIFVGAYAGNPQGAQILFEYGFQLVTPFNDSDALSQAARAVVQAL